MANETGFNKFAKSSLMTALWLFTIALTVLFISLGWNLLQIGLTLTPLLAVTIGITVAYIRLKNTREK